MTKKIKSIILACMGMFNVYSQNKPTTIEASFFRNGLEINTVQYYLIKGDSAFLLKCENKKIVIIDTLSSQFVNLLMVCKNDIVRVTDFNFREALYLKIYFDNSIFNNRVNKRFGGYLKIKNIFRRRYLIDDGLGYVTITPLPKQKFILVN